MKKTFIKPLSLICAAVIALSALTACQSEDENQTTDSASIFHTVTFNSNGGTEIGNVDVSNNQTLNEPAPPTREGHIFKHWESNHQRWDFHLNKVTSNITLEAIWIPAYDIFKLEATDNSNEAFISGFVTQQELGTVIVPEIINGKTIIGLTESAFENINDTHADKIVLPKTLKYISKKSLAEISTVHIELPGPVASLGESSFEGCEHLEAITLTEGITKIPYRCFYDASALKSIYIPKGVVVIEENAFTSCNSLSTVLLPSTLTSIEDSAFEHVDRLSTVLYEGSREEFDKIDIANKNDDLLSAKIYFYSETEPTDEGNFWHYAEDGTPVAW